MWLLSDQNIGCWLDDGIVHGVCMDGPTLKHMLVEHVSMVISSNNAWSGIIHMLIDWSSQRSDRLASDAKH